MVVSTAGIFSAVSALFGGPVVAGALLLEGGIAMGANLIPVLLPGVVAAAIGYTMIVGIGSWGGIPTTPLTVPDLPDYPNTRVIDLLLGDRRSVSSVALLIAVVRRVGHRVVDLRAAVRHRTRRCCSAASWSACSTLAVDAAGGVYDDVLFSGQTTLPLLLSTTSEGADPAHRAGQGARLRDLPRRRLPRRSGVPGDVHRHRRGPASSGCRSTCRRRRRSRSARPAAWRRSPG